MKVALKGSCEVVDELVGLLEALLGEILAGLTVAWKVAKLAVGMVF